MSETELVKRMADTLYSDNGLLAKVGSIEGGVRVLVWMAGVALTLVGLIIAYLAYLSNSPQHHAILITSHPTVTASSALDTSIPDDAR